MQRALLAEAVGTFLLVGVGCGAAAFDFVHGGLGVAGVALVFGMTVGTMVAWVGPVSGAHLNPVVTLSFLARRDISIQRAAAYLVVQGVAAILGAAAVLLVLRDGLAATVTHPVAAFSLSNAFLLEVAITALLVFVILLVATDPRVPQWARAIAIGGAVAFGAFVGGPLTGGSMNPARSLGPAVVAGDLTDLWLYLVAPTLGAAFGFAAQATLRAVGRARVVRVAGKEAP